MPRGEQQLLWLFAQDRPLRQRLGDGFFRSVPRCPGVYIMTDGQGRVLYVGQSGNLRHRLSSYKNIRAEKHGAKWVRLARAVETIAWEECESIPLARLRENELLRLPPSDGLPLFWRNLQGLDFETAEEFFQRGPSRNRRLQEQHGLPDRLIRPSLLDDLPAISPAR